MPFILVRNDIVKVRADAIVNPANEKLLEGSGTSRAIFLAAGEDKLKNACSKLGYCAMGEAVATDAFDLDARYIIHAVCPLWKGGGYGEEACLIRTYTSALNLALKKKCASIAFPLLSSGNYGFPKGMAMKAAIAAAGDFLEEHEMTIYMVLYDRKSLAVSKKLFTAIEEYIDDHYVDEKKPSYEYDGGGTGRRYLTEQQDYGRFTEPYAPEAKAGCIPETDAEYDKADTGIKALKSHVFGDGAFKGAGSGRPSAPLQKTISRRSLEKLLDNLDETFSERLLRLIDERGLKDSYVYKKANIDRRHFSKIRSNTDYKPTKKTVFAFAVALKLSLDETRDLLMSAGYSISSSSRFDVILSFFIENGIYDIFEINEFLFSYGEQVLGE